MFNSFIFHHDISLTPTALLFPPVTARGRFLIHRTVKEHFPHLSSISVGQEPFRRTAVTYSHILQENRKEKEKQSIPVAKTGETSVRRAVNLSTDEDRNPVKLNCADPSESETGTSTAYSNYKLASTDVEPSVSIVSDTDSGCTGSGQISELVCVKSDPEAVEYLKSIEKCGRVCSNCRSSDDKVSYSDKATCDCVILKVQTNKETKTKEVNEPFTDSVKKKQTKQPNLKVNNVRIEEPKESPKVTTATVKTTSANLSKNLKSGSTMVAETDASFGRKKVTREGVRLYRPPAARTNKAQVIPNNTDRGYQEHLSLQQDKWQQQQQYLQALKQYHEANQENVPQYHNPQSPDSYDGSNAKLRGKRPDQQFYVPRRRKTDETLPQSSPPRDDDGSMRPPSPTNSICSIVSEFSGRNRYNRQRRQNYPSLFDGDEKVCAKPPVPYNRENSYGDKTRKKSSLFSNDTLQLIERCVNQENAGLSLSCDNRSGTPSSPNHSRNDFCKSFNDPKDFHPVHSKENLLHPFNATPKSKKGKKTRKRRPNSRDASAERRDTSFNRSSYSNLDISTQNFYSRDKYSNVYDRVLSPSSSSSFSGNSSIETISPSPVENNWRCNGRSLPTSPVKNNLYYQENSSIERRHSTGTSNANETEKLSEVINADQTRVNQQFTPTSGEEPLINNEQIDCSNQCNDNRTSPNIVCEPIVLSPENEVSFIASPVEDQSLNHLYPSHDNYTSVARDADQKDPCITEQNNRSDDNIHSPTADVSRVSDNIIEVSLPNSQDTIEPVVNLQQPFHKVVTKRPKIPCNWADEVDQTEGDSWDSLYDDSGNCLEPCLGRQLNDAIGNIRLEKPSNDYSELKPVEPSVSDEQYGHVIEIFDFPAAFKTQELMTIFHGYQGLDIKWVDDTHALGIFNTSVAADQALACDYPMVKTRPLSLASHSSKAKAIRITDALLPYKPRPETSAALARRLVTGALGLKVNISKEVREAERRRLKDAREKRRMIAKQKEDAWEGTLANLA